MPVPWSTLEAQTWIDPGGRGIAGHRVNGQALAQGQLAAAARHLAESAHHVGIVTGFCIVDGQCVMPETDGPPGSLYLARALLALGVDVTLISDALCLSVLEAGCDHWGLPRSLLCEMPYENNNPTSLARCTNEPVLSANSLAWVRQFFESGPGNRLSHLVAVERCGPSHTYGSLLAQHLLLQVGLRDKVDSLAAFLDEVPDEHRNVCHNMRGVPITAHTAKTHLLFEHAASGASASSRPIATIGMADGGNEIGMGAAPWHVLRQALQQARSSAADPPGKSPAGRIICRIPTDFLLIAGVSNWAAYAFALGLCAQSRRLELAATWDAANQADLIETLVRETNVVDGVTKRREATVDGLPLDQYLATLSALRVTVGL